MKVIQLYKSEDNLIKRAIQQNRDAQRVLYDRYVSKMLGVCRQYIRDLHYAEDCMISGFASVFKNLPSYRNEGSFEGWIRRIMIRECISFLRAQKNIEFSVDEFTPSETPFVLPENSLSMNEIQELIDKLPDGYRIVFNMFAIEGYKHAEIAEMLSIDVNTSKSQLFKARKYLQKNYAQLNVLQNGTS
ncbi:RNA polymerase sigma factor [Flavobacteriaceae bacterium M23B6Z8]